MNISEVIEKRRASWASKGVPVRAESESAAREALNEKSGLMTAEDFAAFCRSVQTTWRDGEMHYARFAPAFQGASMHRLYGDGDALNEWTERIWRAESDEAALAAVDEVLRHPDRLPGSGPSYPSVLMYLRDPSRFFPWTANLDKGLREVSDYAGASRSEGSAGYVRFCEAARQLAVDYSLAPQEVDGILTDAMRSLRETQVRPQDVADELGVSVDEVRAFLREVYPRKEEDQGRAWVLTPEQLDDVESHFGSVVEPEEEGLVDPWDEFIKWARRCFDGEGFDEYERNYKLKIAEHLQTAAEAIEADEDWFDTLKRAFGAPNNLTYFITHSRFLDWVKDNQDVARAAILQLWDEDRDVGERIDEFSAALPSDQLQGQGARLQIGSFLLLTRPTEYVIYRPTPFDTAIRLVDYSEKPKSVDGDVYKHALGFLDELMRQGQRRGLQLRDRLDAQSLVWSVAKADESLTDVMGLAAEEAEAFLRYVGARPSAWWVNQGNSYRFEVEHGIVQASLKNKAGHDLQHWKNIELLRPGDVIVHYAVGSIRALSVVTKQGTRGPRPWQSDDESGRHAKTEYFELPEPLAASELDAGRRTPDAGPFDRFGGVKQVYLEPLSVEFSEYLKDNFKNKWPEGHPWAPQLRNTWLFQAQPAVWDLEANLAAMDVGDEGDWTVSRYKSEIAEGDRVLLWKSGDRAGIYGIGIISGELFERAPDDEHYTGAAEETAIPWRLTRKLDKPLLRSELMEHQTLSGLSVIAQPQATNFRITDEQWSELRNLLDGEVPDRPVRPGFPAISLHVANQGLIISERTLRRFHVSLATRGFAILSGVSGTGKTWLTEVYAEAIGARYLLVPVAPNWTTNEDLLGYLNPIDGAYHDTAFSNFLREAAAEYEAATAEQREPGTFILTLDEMNLARVEYYFAKFLSAMEARTRYASAPVELSASETVQLTPNLLFVGTVNIDETTHGFADKVFDRAQLVELEAPREAIAEHIGQAAFRDTLLEFYDAVEEAKPFAFRVVDEVKSYIAESEALDVKWVEAIDEQMLQKVLPKLSGADPSIRFALEKITHVAEEKGLQLTFDKATRMLHDYDRDGFASYF